MRVLLVVGLRHIINSDYICLTSKGAYFQTFLQNFKKWCPCVLCVSTAVIFPPSSLCRACAGRLFLPTTSPVTRGWPEVGCIFRFQVRLQVSIDCLSSHWSNCLFVPCDHVSVGEAVTNSPVCRKTCVGICVTGVIWYPLLVKTVTVSISCACNKLFQLLLL